MSVRLQNTINGVKTLREQLVHPVVTLHPLSDRMNRDRNILIDGLGGFLCVGHSTEDKRLLLPKLIKSLNGAFSPNSGSRPFRLNESGGR